jgi:AmmeMemoRadiSam system protein B
MNLKMVKDGPIKSGEKKCIPGQEGYRIRSHLGIGICINILIPVIVIAGLSSISSAANVHYSIIPDYPGPVLEFIRGSRCDINTENLRRVCGGITTHHFLAAKLIVEYFEAVSVNGAPKKIILLGPDHFTHRAGIVSVSSLSWVTPLGVVEPDIDSGKRIYTNARLEAMDEGRFFGEHSIGTIMPFIKAYFPGTKVVPIIMTGGVSRARLDLLVESIRKELDEKTHVMLSMDFSHGKSPKTAKNEDKRSIKAIIDGDCESINELDVDNRSGLYVMLRLFGTRNVRFGTHATSAEISGKELGKCTSYMDVYFLEPKIL